MRYTTKYKFNLIETSDKFSPEALNANAEAAERELAALAAQGAAADAAIKALNADVHPGAAGQIIRIATDTYVGTGTMGQNNPNSLKFSFKPMMVIVGSSTEDVFHLMFRPCEQSMGNTNARVRIVWGEQSVTWHYASGSGGMEILQCNTKGVTYNYTAIGVAV